MLGIILLIILVLLLVGMLPHWPYTRSYGWGYWPSGIVMIFLIVIVILLFTGTLGTARF